MNTVSERVAAWFPWPSGPGKNWIRNPVYDSTLLLGSSVAAFLVAWLYALIKLQQTNLLEPSKAQLLNFVIPILLGGPHIFFGFARTYLDWDFVRDYRRMLKIAPHVIFFGMLYLTLHGYKTAIVNVAFYSATFHGLAQLSHVMMRYRKNAGEPLAGPALWAELVFMFSGPLFYLTYALSRREFFSLGFPITHMFSGPVYVWGLGLLTLVSGTAVVAHHLLEALNGRFNWQKTFILAATQGVFLFLASITDFNVAFQAYNAWHSLQAMGLWWAVSNSKLKTGKLTGNPSAVRWAKDGNLLKLYGAAVTFAVAIAIFTLLFSNFSFDQKNTPWYFLFPVTVLLLHHYLEYFLFFRKKEFQY